MSDASEVNEGVQNIEDVSIDDVQVDQPEETAEQAPFLEVDLGDEKLSFNSQDEIAKHVREGTLRQSDYTKKTQEVAEQRKAMEEKERQLEQQLSAFLEQKGQYDKIDGFFKKRPDVRDYILQNMRQPDPHKQADYLKKYAEEQTTSVKKELDELKQQIEAEKRAKQYEQQRKEVFGELSGQFEDFNEEAISKQLEEIQGYQSLPEKEALRNFAQVLYYASKGRTSPIEQEEKQARRVAPMKPGVKPVEAKSSYSGDMDEIAFKLKKEAGLA